MYILNKNERRNMRKLALNDEILLKIEKPARYIGNEVNSVMKDKNEVDVRFAMCFPDVYEIGMSHLGIQILYDMFNQREDVWCERVYSPWLDLHKIMKEEHIPLFALESQDPIRDFDFLGITIQYEMCYTNILQILDLSRIPFTTVVTVVRQIQLLSEVVHVRIIRNHWQNFLIFSISEKGRLFTTNCWMPIKSIGQQERAVSNFWNAPHRSKDCMCRCFTMPHTMKTERLLPLHRTTSMHHL